MQLKFPLTDVRIEMASKKKEVKSPLYDDGFYRLNQHEFSMDVEGVGWFYAANGNFISLVLHPDAKPATVDLYLNGSTYGAILHQRGIMPLHGSCFVYQGNGIMLCGESGAGKSSLTAAFCKDGCQFLTDDVTPIAFTDERPYILPRSDKIKLWDDSLKQLDYPKEDLTQIWEGCNKFYLPIESSKTQPFPLQMICIIEIHECDEVKSQVLKNTETFESLRNEIYRWEYLQGMPDTEASYLYQILNISAGVTIVKVTRPQNISIERFKKSLQAIINAKRQPER